MLQGECSFKVGCESNENSTSLYLVTYESAVYRVGRMGDLWISVLFRLLNSVRKNYRGKFLKKLWCCVGEGCDKKKVGVIN